MRRYASFLLLTLLALSLGVGLSAGAVPLTPGQLWHGLTSSAAPERRIVFDLRVPRVLLGFLVGGTLGVSGASLQALVRNPLGEPYLLGLSGGAGLGAVLAIGLGLDSPWAVPAAAFIGSALAVALVYRLSVVQGKRLDPRVLLLAGVVVGAFAAALMVAILAVSDAARLRNAYLWLLGGLSNASWQSVLVLGAWSAIPLVVLLRSARPLDLLVLGDDTARHLGADVDRTRRMVYLATSLLTAAGVATCGIIGFVGLVVPHAVRQIWGPLHRTLLPLAFLGGGIFLVLADALARTILRPAELPVGAVTAIVGVPLFALLLRRSIA